MQITPVICDLISDMHMLKTVAFEYQIEEHLLPTATQRRS